MRGKDALFGSNVVFKAAVTVKMIRRDVENHGDVGMELLSGFQLEARYLEYRPAFVGAIVDERHNRDADVAANQGGQVASVENLAEQRGGGGFAIGAGDGERMALEKTRGKLQFADDRQAEVLDLHQLGSVKRHAGADHDQVLAAEGEQAVAAGFDHDARFHEGRDLLGQRLGAPHIGDSHVCAAPAEKQRCRETGFSQSNNQNFFAFEFQHRVFSSGLFDLFIVRR